MLVLKIVLKIIRGQLFSEKVLFENTKISPIYIFLKFQCDYDLSLCWYLNPELPKMRDSGSLWKAHVTQGPIDIVFQLGRWYL